MASKNTFRNCNDIMLQSDSNTNVSKVNNVAKVVDNIMSGFMKRYLVVLAELEEMKREVVNNIAHANECINNIKKETNVNVGLALNNNNIVVNDGVGSRHHKLQSNINIPNIEHKCLMRSSVKNILRQHPKYNNKPLSSSSTTSPLSSPKKYNNKTSSTTTKPHSPSRSKKCLPKKHSKTKQNTTTPVSSCIMTKNVQQTYNNNNVIPSSSSPLTTSSSKLKALYVLINNTSLLTYTEKIKLIYLNQHLLHLHHIPNILNDSLLHIQNKITKLKLNETKLNSNEQDVVNKLTTFPTETAMKGIDMLYKYKGNDNDNEKNVMNMVFTCLNKTNDAERFDNVKQGYEWLYKEIGVCSIKEMFYEEIFRKIYRELKCDNVDQIIKVVEMNNKEITENENKELYYIHFAIKEITEFLKEAKDLLNENINDENNNIKKEVIRLNMLKYYMKIEENIKKGIN